MASELERAYKAVCNLMARGTEEQRLEYLWITYNIYFRDDRVYKKSVKVREVHKLMVDKNGKRKAINGDIEWNALLEAWLALLIDEARDEGRNEAWEPLTKQQ